jgi:hypothetical protein
MWFRYLILPFCVYIGPSSAAKVPRLSYQIVLDEESEQPTDEDEESVHSIQGKETGSYGIFFLCAVIR